MINFTNNKKLNIKINILLAAFLEDEFYDIEVCLDEINKSLQENIGIWTYVHKTDDGYYHPVIYTKHNDKRTVIHLYEIRFNDRTICFKTGLKIILAYILVFIMKKDFNKVVDVIKDNNAVDGATLINKFINENETYYDVKNVIETAIKNNDIDIEKLCESLNI